jgi:glutaredoxin
MRIVQVLKPSIRISQAIQGSSWLSKRSSHVAADISQQQTPFIKLYQYKICPFCSKVKAVLGYAGIDHEIVEVNPLTKAELKW